MPRIPDAIYYDDPNNIYPDTELVLITGNRTATMHIAERALLVAERIPTIAASQSANHAREFLTVMRAMDDAPVYWSRVPMYYDDILVRRERKAAHNRNDAWWYGMDDRAIATEVIRRMELARVYTFTDLEKLAQSKRMLFHWLPTWLANGWLEQGATTVISPTVSRHAYYKTVAGEQEFPYDGYVLERDKGVDDLTWQEIKDLVYDNIATNEYVSMTELAQRIRRTQPIGYTRLSKEWLPELVARNWLCTRQGTYGTIIYYGKV